MTKKHFEWAAAYVRHMGHMTAAEREQVIRSFIDLFAEFGPRFDAERFRVACRGADATDSAGRTVRYGRGDA